MNPGIAAGLYFGLQTLRREPVWAALRDVLRTESLSLDELEALQLERFKSLAADVSVHAQYFADLLRPYHSRIAALSSSDALHRLLHEVPVTGKDTIRTSADRMLHRQHTRIPSYPNKTSGSSGTPFVFPCDQVSWAYRHALEFRCYRAFGVRVGDPYMYVVGFSWAKRIQRQTRLKDAVFNRSRISAFTMNPESAQDYIRLLRRRQPRFLLGYPSALYELAVILEGAGYDPRELPLKAVFTQSEALRHYQREKIRGLFQVPVVNTYGSAESGMVAYECPAGNLHVNIEAVLLRRPATGDRDTTVTTDLFQRSFPILNYLQGDEAVFKAGSCSCGRKHPLLGDVEGRSGDRVRLPDGRSLNPNVPSYIFKNPDVARLVLRYRFVNKADQVLRLFVVPVRKLGEKDIALLRNETHRALGSQPLDFAFEIVETNEIPLLANAKHRDFVRED